MPANPPAKSLVPPVGEAPEVAFGAAANPRFTEEVAQIPLLFARLQASELVRFSEIKGMKGRAGIYVFFEDGVPVHVGRTRNFGGRLRSHVTPNHNSASFAFKRTRRQLNLPASYTPTNSRAALVQDSVFGAAFLAHIARIRGMTVRFLEEPNPVRQYLLELYATLAYGLGLEEFDTH